MVGCPPVCAWGSLIRGLCGHGGVPLVENGILQADLK